MRAFDLAHLTNEQKAKLDAMEKELNVVLIAWDQAEQKGNSQEQMNYDI
ncbi:hypothetical protein [Fictibacillus fluitans]|uniref:Uncharacterized protein n=1 Tax=Fictibacillus fluitans TaxID=3058422 RepID=A0ABT8I222_9BACL|nr:hypothetical protein [Fictibacillus sp. NE201]MDN4526760.1 hypothetical protein [Fictibacillus sp. NE201]